MADTVSGYDFSGWAGLVAPKGTPQAVVGKLHAALAKTLAMAEVKDGLEKQGAEIFEGSPEDFRKFLVAGPGEHRSRSSRRPSCRRTSVSAPLNQRLSTGPIR